MNVPFVATLPSLPSRPDESHKGTYGQALLVAGSRGMSGAACLAGLGALRGGAGLVTLAVPVGILPIVAAVEPSYLTIPLPEDDRGRISRDAETAVFSLFKKGEAAACGPGLGTSPDLSELVQRLYRDAPLPMVFDADGLNALAQLGENLPEVVDHMPRILTPHPGEFARLLGTTTAAVQQDRQTLAVEFAQRHQVIVLLKGHATVITDGARVAINTTGNSGMATGGTGDVLTGLITALLAQGMPPFEAAQLGAHLHGLAGDLAAAEKTKPGLIASDLPAFLPLAWKQVGAS